MSWTAPPEKTLRGVRLLIEEGRKIKAARAAKEAEKRTG